VLIPARYASTRFPGKALADIGGKPMVVRVCERARRSGARSVTVATDDGRIRRAVEHAGFRAVMTRSSHASGTDRLAEASARLRLKANDVVVNVQGDEPLIEPTLIRKVAERLSRSSGASLATACYPIRDKHTLTNPNVVKVVLDAKGYALYFSRSRIPFPRDARGTWYGHPGIYAYRVGFLKKFSKMKRSPEEKTEALEQLRALWHGFRVAVVINRAEIPPGVDTPRDLEAVRRMLR
jgi:3-deoxy-manno-octulosonate cytidylyltransferase (CMP-KDO synthetase)